VRSFGDHPEQVGRLSAAVTTGLQEAGVAATAKHFPGHSDVALDSHQSLPVIPHSLERLRQVELQPFAAAIRAGVRLIMTGHLALTALDNEFHLPATLSPAVINDLLRGELGFKGVVVTDAMDMGSIQQGPGLVIDGLAAILAGVDLLLFHNTPAEMEDIFLALMQAAKRGLLPQALLKSSVERILELKSWLARFDQPGLEVVGCKEHQALALEIACRSVTLIHDHAQCLPLGLHPQDRLAVILPIPQDLTPADTSSYVEHTLAQMLRRYHPAVEERLIAMDPDTMEVAAVLEWARGYDRVIVGTINARQHLGQADLVNSLLEAKLPTIAVALRMPVDLQTYPSVPTYLCTYSLLPPAMEALAKGLFGQIPFQGKLPVNAFIG
jgi:beta-N-acetylhexosaminidase